MENQDVDLVGTTLGSIAESTDGPSPGTPVLYQWKCYLCESYIYRGNNKLESKVWRFAASAVKFYIPEN